MHHKEHVYRLFTSGLHPIYGQERQVYIENGVHPGGQKAAILLYAAFVNITVIQVLKPLMNKMLVMSAFSEYIKR